MIPIVPMPVFPWPDWDAVFGADLRASNADRDVAADILCAAVADGRLTLAELDQRLEDVLAARTLREIARRISDLSGPSFSESVRPAARPKPAAPPKPPKPGKQAVQPPACPQPQAATRWSLLQLLLTPAAPADPAACPLDRRRRRGGQGENRVALSPELPLLRVRPYRW
jgi:hypothetical protein